MAHFTLNDIQQLDHLYKINLINSCSGYKSANLIATKCNEGITNVAVFSSVTHLGSSPPLLGFFLRPTTVPRNTYENIKQTGKYTINHIHRSIIEDAHHTSAKYDKNISEFDVTDLEETFKNGFYAPFVADCPVQIAMSYVEEYHIKSNDVLLIVGQIEELYIKDELITDSGFADLSKGEIATINGLDGYAVPTVEKRLQYQRPKIIQNDK